VLAGDIDMKVLLTAEEASESMFALRGRHTVGLAALHRDRRRDTLAVYFDLNQTLK
jgi:hypothetical protein